MLRLWSAMVIPVNTNMTENTQTVCLMIFMGSFAHAADIIYHH